MKKILVAVDGSEASSQAAAVAADLARATGASVTLVNVFDAPGVAAMGLKALDGQELARTRERVSKPALERAAAAMGDLGNVQVRTEIGDPASEIVALVRSDGFDHVVMGSRGRSPLAELALGSVSDRVLRAAPCPVTVVR